MDLGGHVSANLVEIVTLSVTALAVTLAILRLFSRKVIVGDAGIDDALIALGLVS